MQYKFTWLQFHQYRLICHSGNIIINAIFDADYTDYKKSENANIIVIAVGEDPNQNGPHPIKHSTDGSVLAPTDSGAALVSPDLKTQMSLYFKEPFLYKLFTSELSVLLKALNCICNIRLAIFNILTRVDSESII